MTAVTDSPGIAAKVRQIRRELALTQNELAQAIGLRDAQTVSNWERGVSNPSLVNIRALAHLCKRPASWFFEEDRAS